MDFYHKSVLLNETIDALDIKPDGIYVDGTTGGGGHSLEIVRKLKSGMLYCFDKDEDALHAARNRLKVFSEKIRFIKSDFSEFHNYIEEDKIDGLLLDLGVSSYQLDSAERGFSYTKDAPLDMRMDKSSQYSAYNIVNETTKEELTKIIKEYGEERFAYKIAENICKTRESKPIDSTLELAEIIKNSIPKKFSATGHHPAKKTFQAIRIAVNGELDVIRPTIEKAVELTKDKGRIAIITFHSLEDRIVKNAFNYFSDTCTCPPDFPVCVCGGKSYGKKPGKPIIPTDEEIEENPRARSAKLRVFERNNVTYSRKD